MNKSNRLRSARQAMEAGDLARAKILCGEILALYAEDFDALWLLAQINLASGDSSGALKALRHVAKLRPQDNGPWFQIGHLLKAMGRIEEARETFRMMLAQDPTNVSVMVSLTQVHRYIEHDAEVNLIEECYAKTAANSQDRRHLAFALGKIFDDLGEYLQAFRYIQEANQIARGSIASTLADDQRMFKSIETVFDAEFLARYESYAADDASLVFVLGMPRSGTTLAHQIIASHSAAVGGSEMPHIQSLINRLIGASSSDELDAYMLADLALVKQLVQDYLRTMAQLKGTASLIVDKSISNILFAGFIGTVLPRAKLISCRRDPRDVCWSIFRNDIPTQEYGYDLERIGRNHQLYLRLLSNWEALFPGRLFTLRYESLATDPENSIRQLLDYCELPFETACLDFHQAGGSVKTASAAQVRKPIHQAAIGQWRNYESQLTPLLEVLDLGAE